MVRNADDAVGGVGSLKIRGGPRRGRGRRDEPPPPVPQIRGVSATPMANSMPATNCSWIVAAHAGRRAAGTRVE